MRNNIKYWRYIILRNVFSWKDQLWQMRYYLWPKYKHNFTKKYVIVPAYLLGLWMLDGSNSRNIYIALGLFGLLYTFLQIFDFMNWGFSPHASFLHLISFERDGDKEHLMYSLMEFEVKNNIDADFPFHPAYEWKPAGLLRDYLKKKEGDVSFKYILSDLRGLHFRTKKVVDMIEADDFFSMYIKYYVIRLGYLFVFSLLLLQPSIFYLANNGLLVFDQHPRIEWGSVFYFLITTISTVGYGDLTIKYNENFLSFTYACALVLLPLVLLTFLLFSISTLIGKNMEFFKRHSVGYLWRDFLKVCDRVLGDGKCEVRNSELSESAECKNALNLVKEIIAKTKELTKESKST